MYQYSAHLGHWTDWSKGHILGSQVTVTSSTSNLLIALVAVFITLVGGVSWSTIAYTLHQIRATRRETDGLQHLQQVLLRNTSSPLIFAIKIIQTSWAWRKLAKRRIFLRTVSLVIIALLVCAMFVVASVLLSMLATTGDVLLESGGDHCVVRSPSVASILDPEQLAEFVSGLGAWLQQEMALVLAYASQCYPAASQTASGAGVVGGRATVSNCNFYTKTSLNWTTTYPGVCPFNEGVCAGPSSDIIQFDTGYLDSHFDLGVNDRRENRLQFRKITTCAPINTERFSSGGYMNTSVGEVATLNFGLNLDLPGLWPLLALENLGSNVTFVSQFSRPGASLAPYNIQVATTIGVEALANGSGTPSFFPSQEFMGDNVKPVSLIFLANRAIFQEPIVDPWFNATEEMSLEVPIYGNVTLYYNSQPGSVLGCVDDVEICNPNLSNNKCINTNEILYTSVYEVSIGSITNISDKLQFNNHQRSLLKDLAAYLVVSAMPQVIKYAGPYALAAKDYLLKGETDLQSSALSTQQWQVELQRFQAVSMAGLQRSRFSLVAGPENPDLLKYFKSPEPDMMWICQSQKFYSADYFSYSVVGLGLIFGFGGFIIITSIILNFLVPAIQLRTGKGIHRRDQWFTNDAQFLQASLYNSKGHGIWTTEPIHNIPVTMPDEKFKTYMGTVVQGKPTSTSSPAASPQMSTLEKGPRDGSEPLLKVPGGINSLSGLDLGLELTPYIDMTSDEPNESTNEQYSTSRSSAEWSRSPAASAKRSAMSFT